MVKRKTGVVMLSQYLLSLSKTVQAVPSSVQSRAPVCQLRSSLKQPMKQPAMHQSGDVHAPYCLILGFVVCGQRP